MRHNLIVISIVAAFAAVVGAAPVACAVDVATSGIDGVRLFHGDAQGRFTDTGTRLSHDEQNAGGAWADFDGNGRADWFGVRFAQAAPHQVWLQGADGEFAKSEQVFGGDAPSWGVAVGDLDADGDVDVWVSTAVGAVCPPDEVWLNDGRGRFTAGQRVGADCSNAAALADIDDDGDLDAVTANASLGEERPDGPAPGRVWLNDGKAQFRDSGARLGSQSARDVAVADFDDDERPDVAIAALGSITIYRNRGKARFSAVANDFADGLWFSIDAADLDGDGDVDLATANADRSGGAFWLNDGRARFVDSGQRTSRANSLGVTLADVDADGDVDALYANRTPPDRAESDRDANDVWLNDGRGVYTRAARGLGTGLTRHIAVVPAYAAAKAPEVVRADRRAAEAGRRHEAEPDGRR